MTSDGPERPFGFLNQYAKEGPVMRRIHRLAALLLILLLAMCIPALADNDTHFSTPTADETPAVASGSGTADYREAITFFAGYGKDENVLGSGIAYPVGVAGDGSTLYVTDRATLAGIVKQDDSRTVYVYANRNPDERYEVERAISPDNAPLVLLVVSQTVAGVEPIRLARDFEAKDAPCTILFMDDQFAAQTMSATLNGGSAAGTGCIYSLEDVSLKDGNPVFDASGALLGIVYQNRSVASAGYLAAMMTAEGYAFEAADYVAGGVPLPLIIAGGGLLLIVAALLIVRSRRKKGAAKPKRGASPQAGTEPAQKETLAIRCLSGELEGRLQAVTDPVTIGRNPQGCTLVYSNTAPGVSAEHCVLKPAEAGALELTDLGSTYGTFVGTLQLTANMAKALHKGDQFCLGDGRNTYEVCAAATQDGTR